MRSPLLVLLLLLAGPGLLAWPARADLAAPSVHAPAVDKELRALLKAAVDNAGSFTDRFDAEAWLMLQSPRLTRFVANPEQRLGILKAVHAEARRVGLQPELVLAVIEIESRFDRFAVSRAGAQGMMQVMPFWKREIGRPDDNLTELGTNLRYGCTILKHYMSKSPDSWADALARYNGSYGKYWYAEKVMDAWSRWR